jgi:sugar phosphate isomerase/epimerase
MKIGFQTIVWWPFRDPLEYRLKVITAAGYQGVEFKEHPDDNERITKVTGS